MKRSEVKKMISFINKHRKNGMASFDVSTNHETLVLSTKTFSDYPRDSIRLKHKYFKS